MAVLEFRNDQRQHEYYLDGVLVPSVTGILKASGLIDFSRIPRSILEMARRRGTKVHEACHFYNEADLNVAWFLETFPEYGGYLQSWMALADSGRLRTILCEHRVASVRYGFAGTIDWLGEFDGRGSIVDFATGDPEDVAKDLQTGGYLVAAREWATEEAETTLRQFFATYPFVQRYSVRLKKDGSLPTVQLYQDPAHGRQFLTLLEAQHVVRARKPETVDWTAYAA